MARTSRDSVGTALSDRGGGRRLPADRRRGASGRQGGTLRALTSSWRRRTR